MNERLFEHTANFDGNATDVGDDGDDTAADPPALPEYRVEVIRSAKRRKQISGRFGADGVIRVRIPSWMSPAQEAAAVADMVSSLQRKRLSAHIDLDARARSLAARHKLPMPGTMEWSSARRQWGVCRPSTGRIRISNRLAALPPWVLDYVIVHELAHLVEANHGPDFQALVKRYRLAERAEGYLIAMNHHRPECI